MTKMMKVLASALVAIAATGCAAPTPVAVKAPALKAPQAAGVIGPLRQLLAKSGETVDETAASGAKQMRHWALTTTSKERFNETGWYKTATPHYKANGRLWGYTYGEEHRQAWWEVHFAYTGDGAVTYLGGYRYAYTAPADKMLFVNRLRGGVAVNGVPMRGHYDMADYRSDQGGENLLTEIDVVVAPGDTVVFTLGEDNVISGYTCAPSRLGLGPTPGGAGGEAAGEGTAK